MSNARNLADIVTGNYAIPVGALSNAVPADGSITEAKLADGSITASKVADGSITEAKVSNGSITAGKLAAGSTVSNIGYTPANKAGDTFTGSVGVSGAIVATDNVTAYGSV
jgi:hypothetical protein